MQIGKVIRTYRKQKGLTQEDIAKRLGVTTPAVNKWENGASYPDIMLLAPIARLLGISVDTLLSFREELTAEEVQNIIYELDSMLKGKTYDEAFEWAKKKIEEYPDCEMLMLGAAVMLYAQRTRTERSVDNKYDENSGKSKHNDDALNKYDEFINRWYTCALKSDDEDIRTMAADALFAFYMNEENYDKAEEYVGYFSKQNPERKRKQAVIYSKTNRIEEAYKTCEEALFSMYQTSSALFHEIYMIAFKEGSMEKAHMMTEKQSALARVFDMGEYYEISCKLELAVVEGDADAVIDIMKKMLESVDKIYSFVNAPLYEHMAFKDMRDEFLADLKENLLVSFRDKETFAFLQDDNRWQELVR